MALTLFTSIFDLLSVLTLTSTYSVNNPNPSNTTTYLDGTSNLNIVYKNTIFDEQDTQDYLEYNLYNNRTNNLDEFALYPYESHYIVKSSDWVDATHYNKIQSYTIGDTFGGTPNTYYKFDFGISERIPIGQGGTAPYVYHDYFSLTRIGNNVSNPRPNYFNADITIGIIGHTAGNDAVASWVFNFPLYRPWEEGGFKTVLQSYDATEVDDDFFINFYSWFIDIHLVDDGDLFANLHWSEGYEIGEEEGYAHGYGVGYGEGYAEGSRDGFSQGQSSNSSFRNLFGTLIDTPIIYLRKMFDYELFGISVFKALATVISLIVALSVFRLVRGIF